MIDEREEEGERAHQIMGELRTIVGRVLYDSDNDEQEMERAVQEADTWIAAWRERQLKQETVGEVLKRLGFLREVMQYACREYGDEPHHVVALVDSFGWPTREGPGQDLRRLIETFTAYAKLVRDTTGERVRLGELVESLVRVVGKAGKEDGG